MKYRDTFFVIVVIVITAFTALTKAGEFDSWADSYAAPTIEEAFNKSSFVKLDLSFQKKSLGLSMLNPLHWLQKWDLKSTAESPRHVFMLQSIT